MRHYTGSGEYCYVNSLHMCLHAAGSGDALPAPGFLECLTVMPFGAGYIPSPNGPLALFSPISLDPDAGLTLALDALGWAYDEWHGDDAGEAVAHLRAGLTHGPVLIGPLDMGYLPYYPDYAARPGSDHHVVALAVEREGDRGNKGEMVRLHDPAGYPCAVLPLADFLTAWRADRIGWKHGAHRMRARFRPSEPRDRAEMIARTLPRIRQHLGTDPGGPNAYGGARALRLFADDLRRPDAARFHGALVRFLLPLTARRTLDAAAFLTEAGNADGAALLDQKARLCADAQLQAMRKDYAAVAAIVDAIAHIHDAFLTTLSPAPR